MFYLGYADTFPSNGAWIVCTSLVISSSTLLVNGTGFHIACWLLPLTPFILTLSLGLSNGPVKLEQVRMSLFRFISGVYRDQRYSVDTGPQSPRQAH